jgi:hypothetical protein
MLANLLGKWTSRCGWLAAALLLFLASGGTALAAKPVIDPSYANGQIYYMIGPHIIPNPNPSLLAQAEELYIVVYPINPDGRTDLGPLQTNNGTEPLCNPCFHPGFAPTWSYHDHVLTGAPGLGRNGTAGEFKAPWKIIIVMYSNAAIADPNFEPIKSAADLEDALQNHPELFQPPLPGFPGLELDTGAVLICPFVAPDA